MLKFSTGWPDRLVPLKSQKVLWIELKTLTGVLSERQRAIHTILQNLGHKVLVLRTKKEITDALETASVSVKRGKVPSKQRILAAVVGPRARKDKYHTKSNSGTSQSSTD
jgi:hypothetical protein